MGSPRCARVIACTGLLALFDLGAAVAAFGQVSMLLPGDHLAHRRWPPSGQFWLGLYRDSAGYALRQTKVSVQPAPDSPLGGATRVRTDSGPPAMLLLRGPGLHVGRIDTAFSGYRFLYPGEMISFRLAATWYSVRAYGRAFQRAGETAFENYELVLRLEAGAHSIAQTIYRDALLTDENPPRLLWVGDLNRDGRPDLYFSLPAGGYSKRYTLMFSLGPGGSQLVREVADFLQLDT